MDICFRSCIYLAKRAGLKWDSGYGTGRTRKYAFHGVSLWHFLGMWNGMSRLLIVPGCDWSPSHLLSPFVHYEWKLEGLKRLGILCNPCGKSVRGGVVSQGPLPSIITPELRFSFWAASCAIQAASINDLMTCDGLETVSVVSRNLQERVSSHHTGPALGSCPHAAFSCWCM